MQNQVIAMFVAAGLLASTALIIKRAVSFLGNGSSLEEAVEQWPSTQPASNNSRQNQDPITRKYIDNIIQIESSGDPRALGLDGERGLMQLGSEAWKEVTEILYGRELEFKWAFDPIINEEVGTAYLRIIEDYLSDRMDGWNDLELFEKQKLIVAGYNGGRARLANRGYDISKMPQVTRDYVEKLERLSED